MKPTRHKASEKERTLRAVYKRIEAGRKKKDEARSNEASEMRSQQECILSGGVYLCHRLKKQLLLFPQIHSITRRRDVQGWRTGVLACKKLSLDPTRHDKTE